ncbi:hypothetical protein C3E79_11005 [Corynebacterium liangguodongii]|uniref:CAAX prenyl protease 2/Lysostaphin resistance protein A-like domain-containing protein n=2 Tax=Corynebacterium liangguodongii TaxID=2079535 RepID=A0A2S0WGN7_9CORY|nr:hypothetical protein C3E79_11005 [Corynebacterium liangguodongii]PWB99359.1 CPBP family intramembrane metalloprotease [Corynebacterium liangguodongii]
MGWWDLAALTAIFFGPAMGASLRSTCEVDNVVAPTVPEFSAAANWGALLHQALLAAVAAAYLCGRRITLTPWSLRPSWRGAALGIGLYAFIGLVFDLSYSLYGGLVGFPEGAEDAAEQPGPDASLLAYSALNSVYEEVFFLVVCLSLPGRWRAQAVAYSLAVRFAIHTYQGLLNAALIGLVSGSLFLAFTRLASSKTGFVGQWIFPAVVAHALADVFGAGLLSLLFPAAQPAAENYPGAHE